MEKITNVFGVFILYILSTFLLDLRYRTWKDGETFFTYDITITGIIKSQF